MTVAYGAEGEYGDDGAGHGDGNDDELAAEAQAASLRAWEKKYASERAWEDLEEDPTTGRLRVSKGRVEADARERRAKMAAMASSAHAC